MYSDGFMERVQLPAEGSVSSLRSGIIGSGYVSGGIELRSSVKEVPNS